MFLITSGAYLNAEFTAEFGKLPPAFLPVGNKRLYQWQLLHAEKIDERVILSIPEDFIIPAIDEYILSSNSVEIIRVPSGLTLGASIVYCVNVCRTHGEPIYILHGDTLCGDLAQVSLDQVLVAPTIEFYNWAEYEIDINGHTHFIEGLPAGGKPRSVLCGYFAIRDASLLIQSISENNYSFVRGLDSYSRKANVSIREAEFWNDFGHVQLYYQSKSRMTTERSFNSLTATKRWITKSSTDEHKIRAEAEWYESLPPELAYYTPKYLGRQIDTKGTLAYRLEYLYLSTLSELFVFGDLPTYVWVAILDKCSEFLLTARDYKIDSVQPVLQNSYLEKTMSRLEQFARKHDIDLERPTKFSGQALPSLRKIVELCAASIPDASRDDMSIWHGDFCFSNIFYDFRAHQIKTIDPRGRSVEGEISAFGDIRYDVAKLAHCVIGRYDFIVPGFFKMQMDSNLSFDLELPQSRLLTELESQFLNMNIGGYRVSEPWLMSMTITLFLSMLPLHDDDTNRQFGFLANALRLFAKLD